MKSSKIKYTESVSAIPTEVRNKYLDSLICKKNYKKSTKYCIAREVIDVVDSGDFMKWDEDLLKKKLKISDGALRFHKSVILTELRNLTFRNSDDNPEENILSKYKSFSEYFYEGRIERYRIKFILFEKELMELSYKKKRIEYFAILSDIQRMLMIAYFHKRNYIRFNIFIKKIINIRNNKNLLAKLNSRDRSLIEINYLWAMYYKERFNWKNDKDFKQTEIAIPKISELASKHNFSIHYLSAFVINMWVARNNGNLKIMKLIAEKGYNESIKYKEYNVSLLFKAYLFYYDLLTKKINAEQAEAKIQSLYEKSKKKSYYSNTTIYLFDLYTQIVFLTDEIKATQLLKEQINIKLTVGHNYDALYSKFSYLFYNALNNLVEYENAFLNNRKLNYLRIKSLNIPLLSELEEFIKELLNNDKKLFDIKFLSDIYIVQGMIDLFKGKDIDVEKAILIQQRNDRLRRTRKYFSKDWYFNTLRIYFKILSLGKMKKDLLKRDDLIQEFIKQIEYFYNYPEDLGKLEYNILEYASQIINSEKLTKEIIKLYQYAKDVKKVTFF